MSALAVDEHGFGYAPTTGNIVQNIGGSSWLLLMQMEADDSFGAEGKHNGAFMVDRNFQQGDYESRERVVFDSTMNALPVDFYADAAGLTEVAFVGRIDAREWRVQVFSRIGFEVPDIIAEASGTGKSKIALPFVMKKDRSARISVAITYRGKLQSDLLAFAVPAPADLRPMGLSITTYNKPSYVLHNLDVIRSSRAYKSGLIDLLIVNNGDPIEGLSDDVEELKPGNGGGTGGFKAAANYFRKKGRRHFVIMDDDIVLPADLVDRFFALSCFVKGRHIGSLAEIENIPERLIKEQGACVSRGHVFGIELVNPLMDIQGWFRDQLYQFRDVDYSGWWALMVDVESAPIDSMPSYYFIKRDDMTFGFESRCNGTPTAVFPNLMVAHGEEGAARYMYYDVRNDLLMRARNNDMLGIPIRGLAGEVVVKFLTYRLEEQRMFNQALADFTKGPRRLGRRPVGKTLKMVRKLAGKRIPLPRDNPVITSEHPVAVRRMLLAWLKPSAWRVPDPLPLVPAGHRACVTEIGGYIQMSRFSKTGIAYHRRFANIIAFAHGVVLLSRLALGRRRIVARYRKAKG